MAETHPLRFRLMLIPVCRVYESILFVRNNDDLFACSQGEFGIVRQHNAFPIELHRLSRFLAGPGSQSPYVDVRFRPFHNPIARFWTSSGYRQGLK
jgi:hypothetical protein